MPNKNYVAGVAFERRRKKYWEALGWVVIRASGSHGCFDLCCFHPDNFGAVMGIQCKRVKTDREAERLIAKFCTKPPLRATNAYLQVIEIYSQESRKVWNALV